MTNLIDDNGNVSNDRTADYIGRIKAIVKQHFDSLIDSGVTASEIKAVAQNFCVAINNASVESLNDRPKK